MRPITQVDIWNLIQPFLGDVEPAYTTVTLNFGGESYVFIMQREPKMVSLTKVQANRLWKRLANVMNLPVLGVKRATFTLNGLGNTTPVINIEMKPVSKPRAKIRSLRLSKREPERIRVLGEETIQYRTDDLRLIILHVDANRPNHVKSIEELQEHFRNLDSKFVLVALPKDEPVDMYTFEEVETL